MVLLEKNIQSFCPIYVATNYRYVTHITLHGTFHNRCDRDPLLQGCGIPFEKTITNNGLQKVKLLTQNEKVWWISFPGGIKANRTKEQSRCENRAPVVNKAIIVNSERMRLEADDEICPTQLQKVFANTKK